MSRKISRIHPKLLDNYVPLPDVNTALSPQLLTRLIQCPSAWNDVIALTIKDEELKDQAASVAKKRG